MRVHFLSFWDFTSLVLCLVGPHYTAASGSGPAEVEQGGHSEAAAAPGWLICYLLGIYSSRVLPGLLWEQKIWVIWIWKPSRNRNNMEGACPNWMRDGIYLRHSPVHRALTSQMQSSQTNVKKKMFYKNPEETLYWIGARC